MSDEFYYKKDYQYKLPANLQNYHETYKSFSYEKSSQEILSHFSDGKINAAFNAADRHLTSPYRQKTALIWLGTDSTRKTYTFEDLAVMSNKFANLLKKKGAVKSDRIFIFLPRIPYLYFSFLGILKIGAITGLLFSAFQKQALLDRLKDSEAKILITNKDLLPRVSEIRNDLPELKEIIVVDDENFESELSQQASEFEIEHMDPADFAFMLYTSGTTGKPKGVVHQHSAILSQHLTSKYVLDIHDEDIYWCTADPGWVTGIAYTILGIWSCATTSVIYEGRFEAAKWYKILQDEKVTVWYTAPTAIRMLMGAGDDLIKKYDLSSLRHLLSVGEPLNPEAIRWSIKNLGFPFHDTWWQTETGAICIANYPTMDIKLGSMGKPFPGIIASIIDDNGNPVAFNQEGNIALKPGWPSMMKTIWKNEEKYNSYFMRGWYISGDRGMTDKDGYFWFIGRSDDVIKTSGERVGPFEVESALIEHPAVIEAGVIGKPDPLRGEIIKAFVVLKEDYEEKIKDHLYSDHLKKELSVFVKEHLAGHAYPREIEFIDKLPKTRSGKIMRRILKAKELGQPIGDTSTLEEY